MSPACTSCGHPIPAGQFRCGKCGAVQERDREGTVDVSERQPSRPRVRTPSDGGHAAVDASDHTEEELGGREFVVPRGTFASEVPPEATNESRELEAVSGRASQEAEARESSKVDARASSGNPSSRARDPQREPNEARDSGKLSKASHSSSQRLRVARAPERPPYLASEILREDIAPKEPGRDIFAAVISAAGIAGLVGVLVAGLHTIAALALALLFMTLFGIGRLKLAYTTRAVAVAVLSGCALVAVAWWRHAGGGSPTDLLLALGTVTLAGSLYVRSWYRGSIASRAMVGASLVPSCLWAFLTSHRELLSLEFIWQSWLPALTWYVFVILCLLALLAFMGDETTGGCTAWALGLCGWYAGFAGVRFALEVDTSGPLRTLGLAEPALAAPLAVALAQLVAHLVCRRTRRQTQALASS